MGDQGQRCHLGPSVGQLAALAGVLVADAQVGQVLVHAERLQHRVSWVAQRDDQVPGERGVVQPVVDQREVGRLAPVRMERRDDLRAGVLDGAIGRQQFRGVGDEPRVIEPPEVVALGPERRAITRIVAAVLPRIEKDNAGRGERISGRARLGDQQTLRLQSGAMDLPGPPQQPQAQFRRHADPIMNPVPASR